MKTILKLITAICLIATTAVPSWFAANAQQAPVSYKGYYIALTFDDGPKSSFNPAFPDLPPSGGTDKVLDALLALNNRPGVVCGKNPEQFGVLPCRPGIGCGKVCGSISRVNVTFYVNGGNNTLMEAWNHPIPASAMLKRILAEGHEIANHTTTHMIQPTSSHTDIRNQIETTENRINEAVRFDFDATIASGVNDYDIKPSNAVYTEFTDFYGRTYSAENLFKSKSFRPNEFTMGVGFSGVDRDFFGPGQHLPWIFAGLDVDDWRGHTAEQMAYYLLHGNKICELCDGKWCSIGLPYGIQFPGVKNKSDAADGGIVLLHDGTKSFQQAVNLLPLIVPQLQEMGYHFVAMENIFEYMNAEPEFIPMSGLKPGKGDGTRVNDWVKRGNTPILPVCPPHSWTGSDCTNACTKCAAANSTHDFPEGCETTCKSAGCQVKSAKCGLLTCVICNPVSIKHTQKANKSLFKANIVRDKMEIMLDGRVSFVVYDMTGNVVANVNGKAWGLKNNAGRFVANGTYLVIVEATGKAGKVSIYSEILGVKR